MSSRPYNAISKVEEVNLGFYTAPECNAVKHKGHQVTFGTLQDCLDHDQGSYHYLHPLDALCLWRQSHDDLLRYCIFRQRIHDSPIGGSYYGFWHYQRSGFMVG